MNFQMRICFSGHDCGRCVGNQLVVRLVLGHLLVLIPPGLYKFTVSCLSCFEVSLEFVHLLGWLAGPQNLLRLQLLLLIGLALLLGSGLLCLLVRLAFGLLADLLEGVLGEASSYLASLVVAFLHLEKTEFKQAMPWEVCSCNMSHDELFVL